MTAVFFSRGLNFSRTEGRSYMREYVARSKCNEKCVTIRNALFFIGSFWLVCRLWKKSWERMRLCSEYRVKTVTGLISMYYNGR